jgi:hypothetical protein
LLGQLAGGHHRAQPGSSANLSTAEQKTLFSRNSTRVVLLLLLFLACLAAAIAIYAAVIM